MICFIITKGLIQKKIKEPVVWQYLYDKRNTQSNELWDLAQTIICRKNNKQIKDLIKLKVSIQSTLHEINELKKKLKDHIEPTYNQMQRFNLYNAYPNDIEFYNSKVRLYKKYARKYESKREFSDLKKALDEAQKIVNDR